MDGETEEGIKKCLPSLANLAQVSFCWLVLPGIQSLYRRSRSVGNLAGKVAVCFLFGAQFHPGYNGSP